MKFLTVVSPASSRVDNHGQMSVDSCLSIYLNASIKKTFPFDPFFSVQLRKHFHLRFWLVRAFHVFLLATFRLRGRLVRCCVIALWNCFRRQILTRCSAQPRYEHKRNDSVSKTAPYCISTQHRPSPTRHWPSLLRRFSLSLRTADVFQVEATTGNTSAVRRLTFFGSSRNPPQAGTRDETQGTSAWETLIITRRNLKTVNKSILLAEPFFLLFNFGVFLLTQEKGKY